MKTCRLKAGAGAALAVLGLACSPLAAVAQAPVDEDGNTLGAYTDASPDMHGDVAVGADGMPLRSPNELESLVGPVALYPDDLLAIVLPAASYPLQVVEAARFLEDLETDPSLKPDEDWDDSIVALLNYPEIVELMNQDLDWTWQLGEAVVAQQSDVIAAIAAFRDMAYAAGNLKSDEYQTVTRNDDEIIEIEPVSEEVIYVPYYEPARVVVYQPRPVYYYHPREYPVYYYPYPSWYSSNWGYFWGVTTAFTIGWNAHCLNVYHPTFYGHPYYGYSYYNTWWYRRPSVTVYNNYYYDQRVVHNRYEHGDRWRPRGYTRLSYDNQRITRNRYYPNPATAGTSAQNRNAASGQRVARTTAGPRGDRVAGDRQVDGMGEIRRQLEASATPRTRNAGVPGAADRRSAAAGQADRQRIAATANDTARDPSRNRVSRDDVNDIREALAASRDSRQTPATRPAARQVSPNPDRASVPAARPTVPTARDAIPTRRTAIPAERPAIGVRAPERTRTTAAEAAPRASRAPAPVQRASSGDSRAAAPARPAPSRAVERSAPRPSAQSKPSRTVERSAPSRAAKSSARPASRSAAGQRSARPR